jgi:hypothetical protein
VPGAERPEISGPRDHSGREALRECFTHGFSFVPFSIFDVTLSRGATKG